MKTLVSFLFFTIAVVQTATACKCWSSDFETAYEEADIISKGIVTDISYKTYAELLTAQEFEELTKRFKTDGMNLESLNKKAFIQIELEISCTYKGAVGTDKIEVFTSNYSSMCSYRGFEMGKEFIVYLSRAQLMENLDISKPVYQTNNCMRTRPFEKEEDLALCNEMTN